MATVFFLHFMPHWGNTRHDSGWRVRGIPQKVALIAILGISNISLYNLTKRVMHGVDGDVFCWVTMFYNFPRAADHRLAWFTIKESQPHVQNNFHILHLLLQVGVPRSRKGKSLNSIRKCEPYIKKQKRPTFITFNIIKAFEKEKPGAGRSLLSVRRLQ